MNKLDKELNMFTFTFNENKITFNIPKEYIAKYKTKYYTVEYNPHNIPIDVISTLVDNYDISEVLHVLKTKEFEYVENIFNERDLAINVDEELLPFDLDLIRDNNILNFINWDEVALSMVSDSWIIDLSRHVAIYVYI